MPNTRLKANNTTQAAVDNPGKNTIVDDSVVDVEPYERM